MAFRVGEKVTYCPRYGKREHGIVKSIPTHTDTAVFVVYHCDNDWENYKNYTAALTDISDLNYGWTATEPVKTNW